MRVTFRPRAQADLSGIFEFIRAQTGGRTAQAYIERLLAACADLALFPEQGRARDDLDPGIRVLGFERRVAVVYRAGSEVEIARVLYGGRDVGVAGNEVD